MTDTIQPPPQMTTNAPRDARHMRFLRGFLRIALGLITSTVGLTLGSISLFRLGWCRHGTSPQDFGFLHLDWVFQPGLPYWAAHMNNLATMLAGLTLLITGVVICAWPYRRALKRRPNRVNSRF
jgi:ABC-type antimicrobial peptide transport system permease subunit